MPTNNKNIHIDSDLIDAVINHENCLEEEARELIIKRAKEFLSLVNGDKTFDAEEWFMEEFGFEPDLLISLLDVTTRL